jgi:hypothetical protein
MIDFIFYLLWSMPRTVRYSLSGQSFAIESVVEEERENKRENRKETKELSPAVRRAATRPANALSLAVRVRVSLGSGL